jgi:hypothetical protein
MIWGEIIIEENEKRKAFEKGLTKNIERLKLLEDELFKVEIMLDVLEPERRAVIVKKEVFEDIHKNGS